MRRKIPGRSSVATSILLLTLLCSVAGAVPINVVDSALPHFANFSNDPPAASLSHISDPTAASTYGDFGWHNSPSGDPGFPEYAGILFGTATHRVTGLEFQVHGNPFRDFVLQGSTDTVGGMDGTWFDVFSSTVTERSEFLWQEWTFANPSAYSAYRIKMSNDYVGGFAMYRWRLLAEPPVPEPSTLLLLGLGVLGWVAWSRRHGS